MIKIGDSQDEPLGYTPTGHAPSKESPKLIVRDAALLREQWHDTLRDALRARASASEVRAPTGTGARR